MDSRTRNLNDVATFLGTLVVLQAVFIGNMSKDLFKQPAPFGETLPADVQVKLQDQVNAEAQMFPLESVDLNAKQVANVSLERFDNPDGTQGINIWLNSQSLVNSLTLVLGFDPATLLVVDSDVNMEGIQVEDGDLGILSENMIDQMNGQLRLSTFVGNILPNGNVRVATLHLQKMAPVSKVWIDVSSVVSSQEGMNMLNDFTAVEL